jgi:hypothetical protein
VRKQSKLTLFPQRRMLTVKPAYDGMHDGATHKIRLAPDPETLTVDVESPRFPLIKPESQVGRSFNLLLSNMYAFQPGFKFYTKIAPGHGISGMGNSDLLTTKSRSFIMS